MKNRILRVEAEQVMLPILTQLRKLGKVEVCGSYRRKCPDLGDIDLVGSKPEMIVELTRMGEVLNAGSRKAEVLIPYKGDKVQVDIYFATRAEWVPMIMFLTGSADENKRLRFIAKSKGWKLNQYGLWDGERCLSKGMSEEKIYALLGQEYKVPERR